MRYAWLCHPVTVTGVLVLLVNDHLLKQAWPGPVTGKLSDVAGLVVAPALVSLLFRRRADLAATVLTGALFAVVKTTETGAEAASHAWTLVAGPSRVLADPTDLLALPALALAWWARRRSLDRPPSARWRIVVTAPLAVLAVAATSATPPPPSAISVEVDRDGLIHVRSLGAPSWTSGDGGLTWTDTDGGPAMDGRPVKEGQSAMCVPGQATRCYRVVKGRMAVEQSDDGGRTWEPSWQASQDDLARMARRYDLDWMSRAHSVPVGLASTALAVQARPGGGHVVVVANGPAGIVVRDASGGWRHLGRPGDDPAALDLSPESGVAFFLAACTLLGGMGAGLRRHTRAYLTCATVTCLSLLALLNGGLAGAGSVFTSGNAFPLHGFLLFVVLSGAVTCLVLACAGRARLVPVTVGLLAAPLVHTSVYLPFRGWAVGTPDSYGVAVALAALLTGLVLLVSALLIRRDARRADPRPDGR
ncbi:hypothetical protein [Nonomuraea candida]|uniref:hypothetical protein n=1 Tax=Nonomuraea candida TaxID=359159 RepID=UPI0012FB3E9D|nr:hypothetical protein [Nonomuraea candida]